MKLAGYEEIVTHKKAAPFRVRLMMSTYSLGHLLKQREDCLRQSVSLR